MRPLQRVCVLLFVLLCALTTVAQDAAGDVQFGGFDQDELASALQERGIDWESVYWFWAEDVCGIVWVFVATDDGFHIVVVHGDGDDDAWDKPWETSDDPPSNMRT